MNSEGSLLKSQNSQYIVIEKVKDYILENDIKVGEKLPTEKKMCEILGVSRSTLRESIKVLNYSGILKSVQGAGIYVMSRVFDLSAQDVNFLRLKVMIEIEAIKEVDYSTLDNDYWNDLQELLIKREILLKSNDLTAYNTVDSQFHKKIVAASNNAYLIKWYDEILNDIVTYLNKLVIQDKDNSHNTELHQDLYVAYKNKDKAQAIEILKRLGGYDKYAH